MESVWQDMHGRSVTSFVVTGLLPFVLNSEIVNGFTVDYRRNDGEGH